VQDLTGNLAVITALRPVSFNWKKSGVAEQGLPEIGFIADEVETVLSTAVFSTNLDLGIKPNGSPNLPHHFIFDEILNEANDTNKNIKQVGFKHDFFAHLVGAIQELNQTIIAQGNEIAALKAKVGA
jgi:hypothetical protein